MPCSYVRDRFFVAALKSDKVRKGMLVKDGYLYVCDVNRIVVFSLKERTARPRTISLPEGNLFPDFIIAPPKFILASRRSR